MDRVRQCEDQREATVLAGWSCAVEYLLCIGKRARREPGVDANDRRAVHRDTILRGTEDDSVVAQAGKAGESQASEAADADNGFRGNIPKASVERAGGGTPNLPVFIEGNDDLSAK